MLPVPRSELRQSACRWFDSGPGHHFQLCDLQRVPGIARGPSVAIDSRPAVYRESGLRRPSLGRRLSRREFLASGHARVLRPGIPLHSDPEAAQ